MPAAKNLRRQTRSTNNKIKLINGLDKKQNYREMYANEEPTLILIFKQRNCLGSRNNRTDTKKKDKNVVL